jgi:hypothetical protein
MMMSSRACSREMPARHVSLGTYELCFAASKAHRRIYILLSNDGGHEALLVRSGKGLGTFDR